MLKSSRIPDGCYHSWRDENQLTGDPDLGFLQPNGDESRCDAYFLSRLRRAAASIWDMLAGEGLSGSEENIVCHTAAVSAPINRRVFRLNSKYRTNGRDKTRAVSTWKVRVVLGQARLMGTVVARRLPFSLDLYEIPGLNGLNSVIWLAPPAGWRGAAFPVTRLSD